MADASFKFLGYRVQEASIEVKDEFYQIPNTKNALHVDLHKNFLKENNRFVEIVLRVRVEREDSALRVVLTIKGGFEASKEMSEDLFQQMSAVNAPAVLYPYARSFVTTLVAQSGLPPVILPLINFASIGQAEKTEEH